MLYALAAKVKIRSTKKIWTLDFRFLSTAILESSSRFKIVLSSRDDGDIQFRLKEFSNANISASENFEDLHVYISVEVQRSPVIIGWQCFKIFGDPYYYHSG